MAEQNSYLWTNKREISGPCYLIDIPGHLPQSEAVDFDITLKNGPDALRISHYADVDIDNTSNYFVLAPNEVFKMKWNTQGRLSCMRDSGSGATFCYVAIVVTPVRKTVVGGVL